MTLPERGRADGWGGRTVVDRSGAAIGHCIRVWTDDATGRPEWATARMGSTSVLLPLTGAAEDGDRVRVVVTRDQALLAPAAPDDGHLTPDEEARLYAHYGIPSSIEASPTLLPAAGNPAATAAAAAAAAGAAGAPEEASRPTWWPVSRPAWRRVLFAAGVVVGALVGLAGVVSAVAARRRR